MLSNEHGKNVSGHSHNSEAAAGAARGMRTAACSSLSFAAVVPTCLCGFAGVWEDAEPGAERERASEQTNESIQQHSIANHRRLGGGAAPGGGGARGGGRGVWTLRGRGDRCAGPNQGKSVGHKMPTRLCYHLLSCQAWAMLARCARPAALHPASCALTSRHPCKPGTQTLVCEWHNFCALLRIHKVCRPSASLVRNMLS